MPSEPAAPVRLSIAEAAARLGVSGRTLRYYEELGFLTPARTGGGHRLFGEAELATVERILRMQALGLSLATIGRVLHYRSYQDESGRHTIALADMKRIAGEARADMAAVQARIIALRRELEEATREAEALQHDVAFIDRRLAERLAAGEHDGGDR
ncbi:MAG TPA: MerR family transcriptional regulator [Candidatus Elarobacter sp.]|jgi:DNA-binding transcriptional MerR regulator